MSRLAMALRRPGKVAQNRISAFLDDERGTTAVEYSMIASGIALAIITTVFALGDSLSSNFYGNIADEMTSRTGG